jgi:prefoldin subunit 5
MRAIEEHVDLRFDELDKRLELVERRLDRLDSRFSVFEFQMAGIGKSLTIGEKFDGELSNTQVAQQRAIDELARRVAKIEQRLNQ